MTDPFLEEFETLMARKQERAGKLSRGEAVEPSATAVLAECRAILDRLVDTAAWLATLLPIAPRTQTSTT